MSAFCQLPFETLPCQWCL